MDKDKLDLILKNHELWLKNDGGAKADLRYEDLSSANLSNVNLREADLSSANLSNVNLREADLRSANLCGANLSDANLSSAKLNWAGIMRNYRPIYSFSGFGSNGYATIIDFITNQVWCGCWTGSFEEFEIAVKNKHMPETRFYKHYMAIIELIKMEKELL